MKIFKRFLTFFVSLFLIFSAASCELFLDETEEKPYSVSNSDKVVVGINNVIKQARKLSRK